MENQTQVANNDSSNTLWQLWYDHYTDVGDQLYVYGSPIILCVGLIGNIFSTVLICNGSFRHMSAGVYLLLLAISDLTIVLHDLFFWVVDNYFTHVPAFGTNAFCKSSVYLIQVLKCISSWMIVAVTTERAVAIVLPHKVRSIATRGKAWKISGVLSLTLAVIQMYQIFLWGIVEDGGCFIIDEYNDNLYGIAFALVDVILYSLAPAVILIVSNTLLINRVLQSKRFRADSVVKSNASDDSTRVMITLVAISIAFIVLTFPLTGFIISDFVPEDILYLPASRELWFYICYEMSLLNHCINFFLYFLTGPKFREEFWQLFRCRCLTTAESEKSMHTLSTDAA